MTAACSFSSDSSSSDSDDDDKESEDMEISDSGRTVLQRLSNKSVDPLHFKMTVIPFEEKLKMEADHNDFYRG